MVRVENKFCIAISGDYLSFHIEDESMRLGVDDLLSPDIVKPEVLKRPAFPAKLARHATCRSHFGYCDRVKAMADESP